VKILEKCQQHKFDSLNNETNILEWHHKNIVKIIKIINEPQYGLGYVIMELYDGQSLQNIVEQFVIPLYHRLW
jgi:predicted aldo/keto reductase-like oxidoreductase